jgi:hypothetical protein
MATLRIDTLNFHFKPSIDPLKYDETDHYRNVISKRKGMRAVDCIALRQGLRPRSAWMIEAKDFRNLRGLPKDSNPSAMIRDLLKKVNDSRDGITHAAAHAEIEKERTHANRFLNAARCQIVLHLEPYAGPASKLFLRDPSAIVLQKLRQMLHSEERPPLVLNIANSARAGVPWTVS